VDETTAAPYLKGKRSIADTDAGSGVPIVPMTGTPMAPPARQQTEPPPGEYASYGDGPHSGEHGFFTVQENPAAQADVQAFGSPAGEPLTGFTAPVEPIGPTLPAQPAEPAVPAEPGIPAERPVPAEPAVPPAPAESSMRPLTPDGQVAGDHCCACCGNTHAPGQDPPTDAHTLPAHEGQPPAEAHTLPAHDGQQPPVEAHTLPAYDGHQQQALPGQGIPAGERIPAESGQVTDPVSSDQTPCACCGDIHPGSEPPPDTATPAPEQGAGPQDESDYSEPDEHAQGGSDDPGASSDSSCETGPDESGTGEQGAGEQGAGEQGAGGSGAGEHGSQPGESDDSGCGPDGPEQGLPADDAHTLPAEGSPGESQNLPGGQDVPAGTPTQPTNPDSPVGVDAGQQVPGEPVDPSQSFVTVPPDQKPGSTLPPTEGAVQPANPGERPNVPPGTDARPGEPPSQPGQSQYPPGNGPAGTPGAPPSPVGADRAAPGDPRILPAGPGFSGAAPQETPNGTPGSGTPGNGSGGNGGGYSPNPGANPDSGYPGGVPGGQPDGNTSPDPNVKFDEGQYLKLVAALDEIERTLKTEATFTDAVDLDAELPLQPNGQTWEQAVTLNERGKAFGGSVEAENDKLRTALQTFVDALEEAKEVFKETDDLAAYSSTAFVGEYPGIGSGGGAL
jgi:hypothetical protein